MYELTKVYGKPYFGSGGGWGRVVCCGNCHEVGTRDDGFTFGSLGIEEKDAARPACFLAIGGDCINGGRSWYEAGIYEPGIGWQTVPRAAVQDRLIRGVMGRLRNLEAGTRGYELQVDRDWERYAEMGDDEIRANMTKHDAFERYQSARQALSDHHAYIAQAMADARALGVKFDPLTGVPEFPAAAVDTSAAGI